MATPARFMQPRRTRARTRWEAGEGVFLADCDAERQQECLGRPAFREKIEHGARRATGEGERHEPCNRLNR